jgi:hypothetical protein
MVGKYLVAIGRSRGRIVRDERVALAIEDGLVLAFGCFAVILVAHNQSGIDQAPIPQAQTRSRLGGGPP